MGASVTPNDEVQRRPQAVALQLPVGRLVENRKDMIVKTTEQRRKELSRKPIAQVIRDESLVLVAMQRRLFDAGLLATAAAVNKASTQLGWEGAGLLEKHRVASIPTKCRESPNGKHKTFSNWWCEHCGEELGPDWGAGKSKPPNAAHERQTKEERSDD